jgi:isopropylmalate/homocitrate/citramalate synthase
MGRNNLSLAAGNVLTGIHDGLIRHPILLEDDTLRDGEQTVGVCFTLAQKVDIARRLLQAGVHRLCVGFPAVSEQEREAARAVLALGFEDRMLYGLSRATRSDVDAVLACGARNISIFVPISDVHLRYKLHCDERTALERTAEAVRYARAQGLRIVGVGLEDATRAPPNRLLRFVTELIAAGANNVFLCDTVGTLTPLSTAAIVEAVVRASGEIPVGVHFHNDLGLATANAISACQAGAQVVAGSFAGLGERAGNTCLEEVATILRVKFGLDLGIDLVALVDTAARIAEIAGMPIPPCKPILGRAVFSHESGIHVHGITAEPATYEPFPPALVGRCHEILFGKHSGAHSVRYLAESNGISASDAALEEALRRIKAWASERGAPSPAQAADILRAVVGAAG